MVTRSAELELLSRGTMTVRGRLPRSSNAIFLVEVVRDGARAMAVYKPRRGERPLWDFPPGLYRREVAAWRLSRALGWDLVPPTVERDGPYGEGSLQRFVEADFSQHYFTLREDPAHGDRLRRICLFDLLANNADRKAGHCLLGPDGRVWAIDNALTFHAEPKLRTVIWDFAGEPVPGRLRADLERLLAEGLPDDVAALLTAEERRALLARARELAGLERFPADASGARYPWPLI
ncbi:MAG TPA: SCO1664 family protein [Candidatus Binatia bacterium]|nr:SCO1664 family protein [Candidatus Binatia bacterium]